MRLTNSHKYGHHMASHAKLKAISFVHNGRMILHRLGHNMHGYNGRRAFRAAFGTSASVCAIIWNKVKPLRKGALPKHLLWALLLMKTSCSHQVLCSITESDAKTFRKWAWHFIGSITKMEKKVVRYVFFGLSLRTY